MLHLFPQKLLDKIFETGDISDILKIGTLFLVYKNKDMAQPWLAKSSSMPKLSCVCNPINH
jgi:hypothetical protein